MKKVILIFGVMLLLLTTSVYARNIEITPYAGSKDTKIEGYIASTSDAGINSAFTYPPNYNFFENFTYETEIFMIDHSVYNFSIFSTSFNKQISSHAEIHLKDQASAEGHGEFDMSTHVDKYLDAFGKLSIIRSNIYFKGKVDAEAIVESQNNDFSAASSVNKGLCKVTVPFKLKCDSSLQIEVQSLNSDDTHPDLDDPNYFISDPSSTATGSWNIDGTISGLFGTAYPENHCSDLLSEIPMGPGWHVLSMYLYVTQSAYADITNTSHDTDQTYSTVSFVVTISISPNN